MPRRGRSGSRHRTRRRAGSSARRQSRRSRSRARPQRRKRQREASSASDTKRNAEAGKKTEGKKVKKVKDKAKEKPDKAEKAEKPEKPDKAPKAGKSKAEKADGEKADKAKAEKPDKAAGKAGKGDKAEKPKKSKEEKDKGAAAGAEDGGKKTKSKKKDAAAKADAKKKPAKAKKEKQGSDSDSSDDSSYSYYSSSSQGDEQQQQQFMNAMMPWAMMQGAMPTAAMGTSGQLGMAGYAQYAAGQYPGYGASYGYTDPYGRPYGASMGEQVPAGYQAPPPPPPPGVPGGAVGGASYMHGPMTEHDRLADERDKARRRLEDEARLRNEELHRKAETERATAAVRHAINNLQNGQFDSIDGLLKTLESVAARDLSKTEGLQEILKKDMDKAIEEAQQRRAVMAELKSMVRSGEDHIKATAELIRENVGLQKENDREDMNDQLENAGLEAQGMSDRYQSFMDEKAKEHEELQSFTKGPALVDLRLVIAKIKKLSSDLTMTATNAASVVREGKQKLARQEAAVARTKRMQELFDQYDADSDGCLSQLEVLQYSQGEFEFTPAESCLERLWRNWVPAGMAGITFDRFQQMKVAIGTARVIERDQERRPAGASAPLTADALELMLRVEREAIEEGQASKTELPQQSLGSRQQEAIQTASDTSGRMVCDAGMNVDIAVALFEKGYTEASVQEAIKSCSTLEEAMSFLNPKHKQTKVHDSTVQGAGDRPRRRATGKKAQTGSVAGAPCTGPNETPAAEQVPLTVGNSTLLQRVLERQPKSKTCEELSASAAPTPSETVSSGDSVAAPTPVEPEKRSVEAAEAMEAVEASMEAEEAEAPPPPPSPVRSIEPNEHGMKWWREAAARWPKIYQNLRLEASLSILRPECRAVTDYLGSVHFGESATTTPVRKRTMEEQASTNGKKKRQVCKAALVLARYSGSQCSIMAGSSSGVEQLPVMEEPVLKRKSGLFPPPESGLLHVDSDDEPDSDGGGYQEGQPPEPSPAQLASDADDGVVWHAKVFTDDYIHPRDCLPSGEVKPRRPMPVIRQSELLSQLQKVGDTWILPGPLNGWPSLVNLQLRSITQKQRGLLPMTAAVKRIWVEGDELPKKLPERCRATFLAPSWMKKGWSKDSAGFVWWFTPRSIRSPCACHFGERLVSTLLTGPHKDAEAVQVHAIAHRYPVDSETLRDLQTWHVAVALEWSHGQFSTLVELAWLNGIGGYGGKSNWVADKLEPVPEIYEAMASSMRGSWNQVRSEIRMIDMPITSKEQLEQYLRRYSEDGGLPRNEWRFKAPRIYASSEVRLRLRSPAHIAGYLLNYISRVAEYDTLRKNCQTFATDFFAFLMRSRTSWAWDCVVCQYLLLRHFAVAVRASGLWSRLVLCWDAQMLVREQEQEAGLAFSVSSSRHPTNAGPECSSVLAERDLRKLLPTETIDRLLARSLEQAVSSSANIRACPTPNCVMRVAIEEGDITKFKCTICKKESCLRCGRQPFHRGMTCEEYAEKLKNSTRAAKKERQADQLFEQWMEKTGSKQCPTCRMAVTKQNLDKQKTQYSECHKMSCRNCGTKFCFKCLAILTDSYTCGCTIDAHGFIDPVTGKIVKHLKKRAKK
ncbi:unnamed protein product [Symbiodinium sp. CCMP2592]|nr:unnamed protein product [Symbiodinium sp. CCMP2592]